jgi:hypothetical protein
VAVAAVGEATNTRNKSEKRVASVPIKVQYALCGAFIIRFDGGTTFGGSSMQHRQR